MKKVEKNWLEWVVFGFGLVLTAATAGYLLSEALGEEPKAPRIVARVATAVPAGTGFTVPVTLRNEGDLTAEGVMVEVTLDMGEGDPERGEFTVGFLPGRSSREGAVTFQGDPRAGRITARVVGYEIP